MMIKFKALHLNFVTVMAAFFFLVAILFAILGLAGVIVVVPFFSKIFIGLAIIFFIIFVIAFFLRKRLKVK